eukprot:15083696-Alexandrium_andersonii.AAC.1
MPCTVEQMYEVYLYMYAMHDPKASRSTWGKAFKAWKPYLRRRKSTQHARCYICSAIAQEKSLALDWAAKQECVEAHKMHLQTVFSDRKISTRIQA